MSKIYFTLLIHIFRLELMMYANNEIICQIFRLGLYAGESCLVFFFMKPMPLGSSAIFTYSAALSFLFWIGRSSFQRYNNYKYNYEISTLFQNSMNE